MQKKKHFFKRDLDDILDEKGYKITGMNFNDILTFISSFSLLTIRVNNNDFFNKFTTFKSISL